MKDSLATEINWTSSSQEGRTLSEEMKKTLRVLG
jgi:hypothetical protein